MRCDACATHRQEREFIGSFSAVGRFGPYPSGSEQYNAAFERSTPTVHDRSVHRRTPHRPRPAVPAPTRRLAAAAGGRAVVRGAGRRGSDGAGVLPRHGARHRLWPGPPGRGARRTRAADARHRCEPRSGGPNGANGRKRTAPFRLRPASPRGKLGHHPAHRPQHRHRRGPGRAAWPRGTPGRRRRRAAPRLPRSMWTSACRYASSTAATPRARPSPGPASAPPRRWTMRTPQAGRRRRRTTGRWRGTRSWRCAAGSPRQLVVPRQARSGPGPRRGPGCSTLPWLTCSSIPRRGPQIPDVPQPLCWYAPASGVVAGTGWPARSVV